MLFVSLGKYNLFASKKTMTRSHHSYSRLVDPHIDREHTVASLRRSMTLVFIASLVAVITTIGIIVGLVAYLFILPQVPNSDNLLKSTTGSGFLSAENAETEFAHVLERLNVLEEEVASLRKQCRSCGSQRDRVHTGRQQSDKDPSRPESSTSGQHTGQDAIQQSVTGVINWLLPDLELIQLDRDNSETVESPHESLSPFQKSPISNSLLEPSSAPPTDATLTGSEPAPSLAEPRRLARSKDRKKSRRPSHEESTQYPTGLQPDHRDGQGSRQEDGADSRRNRDRSKRYHSKTQSTLPPEFEENGCSRCNGRAAHFEGERDANVVIVHDGWIRGPRMWKNADWMTPSDKNYFQLGKIIEHVNVVEGGVYYVYSQVMFYDDNYAVGQSIYINDQPHFTCTKSNMSPEAKQSTCYVGGVVRLSEGDHVGIKLSVSNVEICLFADTTYFGLFRVG